MQRRDSNSIRATERQARHKHRPALYVIEKRLGVARSLERQLFEQGFEVLVLNGDEIPRLARAPLLRAIENAGFVAIYAQESICTEEVRAFRGLGWDFVFDHSWEEKCSDDDEGLSDLVALAELLRIDATEGRHGPAPHP
ncbi:MAG: hypothetical protein WA002_00115 [Candidatus Acidiferrales bacterium]